MLEGKRNTVTFGVNLSTVFEPKPCLKQCPGIPMTQAM